MMVRLAMSKLVAGVWAAMSGWNSSSLVSACGIRMRFAVATVLTISQATSALAHGFAVSRFFPATITIDDPFVADELSLPTVSNQKTGTDPSVVETAISSELS